MTIPTIKVIIDAETKGAEAGLQRTTAAMDRAAKTAKTFGGATGGIGAKFSRLRPQVQNMSFQIADIATQLNGGTAASVALGQQLPQMAAGFGVAGAAAGALLAVGIPLAAVLLKQEGRAEDLDIAMQGVANAADILSSASGVLSLSSQDLIEKFGRGAETASAFAEQLRIIGDALLKKEAREASKSFSDYLSNVYKLSFAFSDAKRSGKGLTNQAKKIADEIGVSVSEAKEFLGYMREIETSDGLSAQADSALQFLQWFESIGQSAANLPPELLGSIKKMAELGIQTQEAAHEAVTLTKSFEQLAAASERAERAEKLRQDAILVKYKGAFEAAAKDLFKGSPEKLAEHLREPAGISGAMKKRAESRQVHLEQMFATERELEIARYDQQLKDFNEYLGQRDITEADANARRQKMAQEHADALKQIDTKEHRENLSAWGGFFGDLAAATSSGNKTLFELGKAASIAESIVRGQAAAVAAFDWGMKAGGPPAAFAFAAASLAKTGAMIQQISSTRIGGGSSSGGGGGGAAPAAAPPPQQTNININATSPNAVINVSDLVEAINDQAPGLNVQINQAVIGG